MRARKCGRHLKISGGMGEANKDSKKRGKKKFYYDLKV